MSVHHRLLMLGHFVHTRWWLAPWLRWRGRQGLEAHQHRRLAVFLRRWLPLAPAYHASLPGIDWQAASAEALLAGLPWMDKADLLADFAGRNTAGVALAEAEAVARRSEISRDFSPRVGAFSVGLSSGTSGQRGVFLVSDRERARWAGILLAKTLPSPLLRQILCFWRPPLRIAFFLRANNNLYQSLNSRRIDFGFYDLLQPISAHLLRLNRYPPDVLVAPASVLRHLAEAATSGQLHIAPRHLISVAEVLEAAEAEIIGRAFARPDGQPLRVHQIYQATEGFLGYSCPLGGLHLNETHLHIGKQWLDPEHTRFQPEISDFSRTTQLILRYRLNDILHVAPAPCRCGRPELTLLAIDGRADEILWLRNEESWQPLYPDLLRRCLMLIEPPLSDYRLQQRGDLWLLALPPVDDLPARRAAVQAALEALVAPIGTLPRVDFEPWRAPPAGAKRRRIQCLWRDEVSHG